MDPRLESVETEFVNGFLEFHPGYALFAGLHDHDSKLEDLSRESVARYCIALDQLRARAQALGGLGRADEIERDVLLSMIEGTLFEYRRVRAWERDPYSYADILSSQLNLIVIFDYAPPEERLRAVIAKEQQIPRFLETARENLRPTAPILVNYGVRGAEGALSLVRKDLPAAFLGTTAPALRRDRKSTRLNSSH